MKKRVIASLLMVGFLFTISASAFADRWGYEHAVAVRYHVPPQVVVGYYNQLGNWGDVETALFISARIHVSPSVVIGLRLGGEPFPVIAAGYGVAIGSYYCPVTRVRFVITPDIWHHYHGWGHGNYWHNQDWHHWHQQGNWHHDNGYHHNYGHDHGYHHDHDHGY